MKKKLAVLLAAAMMMGAMTGCGSSAKTETTAAETKAEETTAAEAAESTGAAEAGGQIPVVHPVLWFYFPVPDHVFSGIFLYGGVCNLG